MIYTTEVQHMCPVAKGAYHGPAPIPEEGKWAKELKDISGFTHGVGWCAPQQGACKLTLNVKEGVIVEALVETLGCSGMTHSAAMASEILIGKTILEVPQHHLLNHFLFKDNGVDSELVILPQNRGVGKTNHSGDFPLFIIEGSEVHLFLTESQEINLYSREFNKGNGIHPKLNILIYGNFIYLHFKYLCKLFFSM